MIFEKIMKFSEIFEFSKIFLKIHNFIIGTQIVIFENSKIFEIANIFRKLFFHFKFSHRIFNGMLNFLKILKNWEHILQMLQFRVVFYCSNSLKEVQYPIHKKNT